MRVTQILSAANAWRTGRLMAAVILEADHVCSKCGGILRAGRRAVFLVEPPTPAVFAHYKSDCR